MSPLIVLLVFFLPPPGDLVSAELEILKGAYVVEGGSLPEEIRRRMRVVIEDGVLTLEDGEQRTALSIRLDPTQVPRQINLIKGQRVARGIYEMKGDQLTLCYEVNEGQPRPRKLAVVHGSEILLILKRVPKSP
jgi:uncharacterized protein (TIGR03067 family)